MTPFPTTLKPSSPATPRCAVVDLLDRGEEGYYVRVQGTLLLVPKALFEAMPSEIRHALLSTGNGLSLEEPIQLRGPITTLQLRYLVHAFKKYPSLDIKKLPLDQLFSIAELSYTFGLTQLKHWSIESTALILNSPQTPLRSACSQIFSRALRLALAHGHASLSTSIQAKWLTRLHWREMSPVPAIMFADRYELRNLLGHAYYIHLVEVMEAMTASKKDDNRDSKFQGNKRRVGITEYCRASTSPSTPLTPAQRTHLLAGYYSLTAHWKRLRVSPPHFSRYARCTNHERCMAVWRLRWTVACSRPCPGEMPEVDVLKRLRWVEEWLRRDELMGVCMDEACWEAAVGCVARVRDEVVRNLGHHFDLG